MKKKGIFFESWFLLIVVGLLLWMGIGAYYEHDINSSFPKGFVATDSFYKYNRAVYLDMTGDNKYVPEYLVGVEGLAQTYPYLLFHHTVLFKDISGLELFNSHFFLKIFYTIMAGLMGYIFIRRYNKYVALLSSGIFGFLFIGNFYTGFLFGWGPQIMGSLLLVGSMWTMIHFTKPHFHYLLGIFIAATMLAHIPEALFAGLFCVILFVPLFIKKKDPKLIGKGVLALITFLVSILFYLPILVYSLLANIAAGTASGGPGFPAPMFNHFGIYGIIIAIGFIASVMLLLSKKCQNWQYFSMAFFMGAITFSVIFDTGARMYQNRFFWPIYFAIFFGYGIFTIIKFTKIKINTKLYYLIPIACILISSIWYFSPPTSNGLIVNEEMWDGITWVRDNAKSTDKILIVYGDSYNQHAILSMFGHQVHYTDWNYIPNNIGYDLSESVNKIQQGVVTRYYTARPFIHGKTNPIRTSFFGLEEFDIWQHLGLNYEKVDGKGRGFKQHDLCSFDVVVMDKQSQIPGLAEYNLKMRNELIANPYVTEVFSNGWHSILRNENLGKNCVGGKNV